MLARALVIDALAFLAALILSLLLTPAIRDFAIRRRYVDVAGSVRKIHKQAIPRLGGVAIFTAWLIAAGTSFSIDPSLREVFWSNRPRTIVFVMGGVAAAALGFVDDLRRLRARYKLVVQLAIGVMLCWAGFTVHELQLPGAIVLPLGPFGAPLTVLWIAGVMNALNLIDGLDGLAGGIAAIALSALFAFGILLGKPLLALYSAALAGGVIGFLVYNFNPASIFMGDAGSLLLGYYLAVASLRSSQPIGATAVEVAVPVLMLGLPICDMALAICRRALRGRGVFSPDREHLHHRLLARGFSQKQAALILWGAAGILTAGGIAAALGGGMVDVIVALCAVGAAGCFAWRVRIQLSLESLRKERRQNQELRTAVTDILRRLDRATALDDVIQTMEKVPPIVSAAAVRTHIGEIVPDQKEQNGGEEGLRMRFSLAEGPDRLGHLELAWDDGRAKVEEFHALALEEICEYVARTVRRVSPSVIPFPAPSPAVATPPVRRLLRVGRN